MDKLIFYTNELNLAPLHHKILLKGLLKVSTYQILKLSI
jgi:hypothetical protein